MRTSALLGFLGLCGIVCGFFLGRLIPQPTPTSTLVQRTRERVPSQSDKDSESVAERVPQGFSEKLETLATGRTLPIVDALDAALEKRYREAKQSLGGVESSIPQASKVLSTKLAEIQSIIKRCQRLAEDCGLADMTVDQANQFVDLVFEHEKAMDRLDNQLDVLQKAVIDECEARERGHDPFYVLELGPGKFVIVPSDDPELQRERAALERLHSARNSELDLLRKSGK